MKYKEIEIPDEMIPILDQIRKLVRSKNITSEQIGEIYKWEKEHRDIINQLDQTKIGGKYFFYKIIEALETFRKARRELDELFIDKVRKEKIEKLNDFSTWKK